MYQDQGPVEGIEQHDEDARATITYGFEKIVTSKGQSGGEIQVYDSESGTW